MALAIRGPLLSRLKNVSKSLFLRKTRSSMEWFWSELKNSRSKYRSKNVRELKPGSPPPIGSLCHYIYDPKHKETLPVWDRFPLALIIGWYDDGWLALNLHYLPIPERAAILDSLMKIRVDAKSDRKYAEVTYQFMKQAVGNEVVAHSVKRYLADHLRSTVVMIDQSEWENVIFLSTQQFQKQTAAEVWRKFR